MQQKQAEWERREEKSMEDDRSGGPWEIQRQGCQSPKLFEEGDASLESLGAEREGSDLRPEVPQKTFHSRGQGALAAHSSRR